MRDPTHGAPHATERMGRARVVSGVDGRSSDGGEGRIHAAKAELWQLNDGAAYFALHRKVPIVPLAINGTSWLRFGRPGHGQGGGTIVEPGPPEQRERGRVTVAVGEPLSSGDRPSREAVAALTQRTWEALYALVRPAPEVPPPGRVGRRLTERFNEWPGGSREATLAASANRRNEER